VRVTNELSALLEVANGLEIPSVGVTLFDEGRIEPVENTTKDSGRPGALWIGSDRQGNRYALTTIGWRGSEGAEVMRIAPGQTANDAPIIGSLAGCRRDLARRKTPMKCTLAMIVSACLAVDARADKRMDDAMATVNKFKAAIDAKKSAAIIATLEAPLRFEGLAYTDPACTKRFGAKGKVAKPDSRAVSRAASSRSTALTSSRGSVGPMGSRRC